MTTRIAGLWILLLGATTTAAPTLVVAPLSSSGQDQSDAQTITRLVRIYAGQSRAFTLVTPEELGAIDEELKRQLSGGCAEASCIADIGGALGAKFMITGSLDRLGKRHILTLKLIDIEQVRAVNTVAGQANSVEEFADTLPIRMQELFGERPRASLSRSKANNTRDSNAAAPAPAAPVPAARARGHVWVWKTSAHAAVARASRRTRRWLARKVHPAWTSTTTSAAVWKTRRRPRVRKTRRRSQR